LQVSADIQAALDEDMAALSRMFHHLLSVTGFDEAVLAGIDFSRCQIRQEHDSFTGEALTTGSWLDEQGVKFAHFIAHANGSLFAECDVLLAHPSSPALFVEAMEVWGERDALKYDLRLLPSL